jgi:hypothetical protein
VPHRVAPSCVVSEVTYESTIQCPYVVPGHLAIRTALRLYFSLFLELIVAVMCESSVEDAVLADEDLEDKRKRKVRQSKCWI